MTQQTEVLYNDTCPVCSREIRQYERISLKHALAIKFDGLNDESTLKDWGITEDEAAKRLHVRRGGQIYGGVPAFIVLWQELPRMQWLARVVNLPGVYWISCKVYDHVLAPVLYRWHKWRQKRHCGD